MPIIVSCHCGRKFQVKEEYAGKQAKCPVCKSVLMIPAAEMEVGEEETMRGDDADEQQQEQQEEQLSPAQEARRQRQIKAEKDAKMRRRNNIIAFGSLGVMILLAVGWSVFGRAGGSVPDSLPPDKLTPTADPVTPAGQQPKPAGDSYSSIPPPPTGQMDEVERYIQWAILAKDSAVKANALIFKPDDPRLNFDAHWRQPRKTVNAMVKDVLNTFLDLESGPAPTAQTDQTEARILMDPDLVGSSVCTTAPGKTGLIYVFVDPVKMKMPDVIKKYGQPSSVPIVSGSAKIHFYGRVSVVETENGTIHCVARRQPKD
jgi:hypothetical protein